MQLTIKNRAEKWTGYLDNTILYLAALVPVGIVIGNAGFESMVALAGLAWVIRAAVVRENPFARIKNNPAVMAWAVWFFCIILSVAVNGAGSKGVLHDIVYIRFFLFVCAVLDLSHRRPVVKYLVWGLAYGILFAALNTIICHIFGYDLFGHTLEDYTQKLRESARSAGMCAMAFPFLMMWAADARINKIKFWKTIAVIGIVAVTVLFQTSIRTALVASLCGIFAGVFFFRFKKMDWVEIVLWVCFVVAGLWVTVKWMKEWDLRSMYDRMHVWQVSIAIWKENLFLGVGVSSFKDAFVRITESGTVPPFIAPDGEVFNKTAELHAHNLFLMLLSTTGILGLVSFLWLFVCCTMSAAKNSFSWKYGMLTWPVVFLMIGMTGWNIYSSWYQALFSFFAVLSLINRDEPQDDRRANG